MKITNKSILGLIIVAIILTLPAEARADRFHRGGFYSPAPALVIAGVAGVAAAAMYYSTRPTYVVAPQTVVVQQPMIVQSQAAPQMTYYCRATGTNYPDTMTCPGGWSALNPGMPPQ